MLPDFRIGNSILSEGVADSAFSNKHKFIEKKYINYKNDQLVFDIARKTPINSGEYKVEDKIFYSIDSSSTNTEAFITCSK